MRPLAVALLGILLSVLYLDNALTLAEAVVPYSSALQEYIAGPSGSLLGYQTSDADAQDHMCLQASHLCGLGFWVRSPVSCGCGQDAAMAREKVLTVNDVLAGRGGFCQTSADGASWLLTRNMRAFGGFTVYCDLGGMRSCEGLSDCEGLVLMAHGIGYQFELVVVEGPFPELAGDFDNNVQCSITDGHTRAPPGNFSDEELTGTPNMQNRQHSKRVRDLLDSANATLTNEGGARQAGMVNLAGWTYTYSGPITVYSKKTGEPKWSGGWVDFTVAESAYVVPPEELARLETIFGTLPRVSPELYNRYRFWLNRNKERY